MSLRVVFMGTPEFAVPSLAEIIANGHEVVHVYTQPPRKSGRGQKLTKSPVHQFAEIMGIEVSTPERFRKSRVIDEVEALGADVACVVAYGQILPSRALTAPKYGCLNLHASLLPRWRGAAPVQRAIMAGDSQTGVQIMQMAKGLDTGDILLSETVDINADDTAHTLSERLSHVGAEMWARALGGVEREALRPTPQIGEASYAHKIEKSEARIDWTRPATKLDCHIRGLSPFPGAWCEIAGERVKIHLARPAEGRGEAGTVLSREGVIACGQGALKLLIVQPAGKPKMDIEAYLKGRPLTPESRIS
jgi:methionyl-tRNA formyltransferase